MPEPKKSKLAEWGSRPMTGREKGLFWLAGLVLLAVVGAVWFWAASGVGEDRQELEDQLNARYQETISVGIQQVRGQTQETFVIDGVTRPDCRATQDGFLECSDDPQPTPVDQ